VNNPVGAYLVWKSSSGKVVPDSKDADLLRLYLLCSELLVRFLPFPVAFQMAEDGLFSAFLHHIRSHAYMRDGFLEGLARATQ
jgi:hypothetical protein